MGTFRNFLRKNSYLGLSWVLILMSCSIFVGNPTPDEETPQPPNQLMSVNVRIGASHLEGVESLVVNVLSVELVPADSSQEPVSVPIQEGMGEFDLLAGADGASAPVIVSTSVIAQDYAEVRLILNRLSPAYLRDSHGQSHPIAINAQAGSEPIIRLVGGEVSWGDALFIFDTASQLRSMNDAAVREKYPELAESEVSWVLEGEPLTVAQSEAENNLTLNLRSQAFQIPMNLQHADPLFARLESSPEQVVVEGQANLRITLKSFNPEKLRFESLSATGSLSRGAVEETVSLQGVAILGRWESFDPDWWKSDKDSTSYVGLWQPQVGYCATTEEEASSKNFWYHHLTLLFVGSSKPSNYRFFVRIPVAIRFGSIGEATEPVLPSDNASFFGRRVLWNSEHVLLEAFRPEAGQVPLLDSATNQSKRPEAMQYNEANLDRFYEALAGYLRMQSNEELPCGQPLVPGLDSGFEE